MKSTLLLAAAGAAALLAGSASQAQGMRGPGPDGLGRGGPGLGMRALQAADANGDKSVARAELDALAAEEFAWRDRNGDGALDEADASPTAQRLRALREAEDADDAPDGRRRDRRRADADEDGRITQAEFLAAETAIFERLDADADGVITPDELDAQVEARRNRGRWWRQP